MPVRRFSPIIIALLLLHTAPLRAEIFRCERQGTVFSDQPCAGAEAVEPGATNTLPRVNAASAAADGRYSATTWYEGEGGYRAAVRAAQDYGAPLIIYFRTDWCAFCRDVDNNLLPQSAAVAAMREFVKVRINPDKGAAEKALFDSFNATGYPTFLVQPPGQRARRLGVTRRPTPDNLRHNVAVQHFLGLLQPYTARPAAAGEPGGQ